MMMPANYSAIAENEMTYVVGGGLLEAIGSVTAPVWGAANVKTFNTNLITIVGNSFIKDTLATTLGVAFGGAWGEKVGTDSEGNDIKVKIFGKNGAMKGVFGKKDDNFLGQANEMSGLNKFMQGVGILSAVYTLGTSTAKSYVGEADPFGVTGGKV